MRCTKFFYQTKVVTNQNFKLLCYVTFFDILHHYGVIAASLICSVLRKYCAVLRNRFFLFLWSLSHSEDKGWGAGMGLPIGLFLFQLWGCPASAVAVAGIGCSLQARPFFGTVALYLFKTLLFPSYAPWCRYDILGVLASGSGLASSA